MTIDQFMRKLAKTPRKWRMRENGQIVMTVPESFKPAWKDDGHYTCPWMYLQGMVGEDNVRNCQAIWDAADGKTRGTLRKRLLKACGLEEASK